MFSINRTNFRRFSQTFAAKIAPQSTKLLLLETQLAGKSIADQHYIGRHKVDVSKVCGTTQAARCNDFDARFQLRNASGRDRLAKVRQANQRRTLPPIKLVLVDDRYYVQDGHHRMSIAIANGQATIDAQVTLIETSSACNMTAAVALA